MTPPVDVDEDEEDGLIIEGVAPDVVARLSCFQVLAVGPNSDERNTYPHLLTGVLRPPLVALRCERPPHADGTLLVLVLLGEGMRVRLDLAELVNHALGHDAEYHPDQS